MGQPDADHPQLVLGPPSPRSRADGERPRCMQRRTGRAVCAASHTCTGRRRDAHRRHACADSRFDAHRHARRSSRAEPDRHPIPRCHPRTDSYSVAPPPQPRPRRRPRLRQQPPLHPRRHPLRRPLPPPRPRRPRLRRPAHQPLPPRQLHPPPLRRQRRPGWSAAKTSVFARSIPPRRSRLPVFATCGARRGRSCLRKSGSTCWTWRRARWRGGCWHPPRRPQRTRWMASYLPK